MSIDITKDQVDELIEAVTRIAYGTVEQPTGLEGVSIAIAGTGLTYPLGEAVRSVASSIDELAAAQHRIADALERGAR